MKRSKSMLGELMWFGIDVVLCFLEWGTSVYRRTLTGKYRSDESLVTTGTTVGELGKPLRKIFFALSMTSAWLHAIKSLFVSPKPSSGCRFLHFFLFRFE